MKSIQLPSAYQMAFNTAIGIAILAPGFIGYFMPQPPWLAASIAFSGLFGALLVCWYAGVLRLRFILVFAVVLIAMAVWGLLFVQS